MIEPIRIEFDVPVPPDRAFEVWTARIDLWWPADHTATGRDDAEVVLEGRVGGRIYERLEGKEHDWGEVVRWEPPRRLVYLWHLRRDRSDATEVEIRFRPAANGTRVEIEHRGWERLGAAGSAAREGNLGGWATLLPHYRSALEE
jgi:uncharacterized protein YndB with AHSA1/START domain